MRRPEVAWLPWLALPLKSFQADTGSLLAGEPAFIDEAFEPSSHTRSPVRDVGSNAALVTVMTSFGEVMDDLVAVMFVVPAATEVASPVVEPIVATPVLEDSQVDVVVMSDVERSVKVPVAANCCVAGAATLGETGVTAILTNAGAATVSMSVGEVTPAWAAVILVVP